METSNKSTGDEWSDLPLYAEDTPVSLSAKQVLAKVKKIIATCGLGYDKPLANYDPITQFLKMSEGIFPLGEQPLLPILPPSGMTRNGALCLQPAWEPIIGETESLSWPTPTTQDAKNNGAPSQMRRNSLPLNAAVVMWPTPTVVTRPMEGNVRMYRAKVQSGEMTEAEAEAEAILGKSVWEAQGKVPAMFPTPTHGKLAGGQGAFNKVQEMYSEGTITDEERKAMQAGNGGKLNPRWVEWLMGFPDGWTDLEA